MKVYVVNLDDTLSDFDNENICAMGRILDTEKFKLEAIRQNNAYTIEQFQNEVNNDITGYFANIYIFFENEG